MTRDHDGHTVRRMKAIVAALLAIALTSCAEAGEPDVDWSRYPAQMQKRIDTLAQGGKCQKLQGQFDVADTAGDGDLMRYVDAKLEAAGCY